MVGGLITPPYVIAKFAIDEFPFTNVELQQYMICASLITRYVALRLWIFIICYYLANMKHHDNLPLILQWDMHLYQHFEVQDSFL